MSNPLAMEKDPVLVLKPSTTLDVITRHLEKRNPCFKVQSSAKDIMQIAIDLNDDPSTRCKLETFNTEELKQKTPIEIARLLQSSTLVSVMPNGTSQRIYGVCKEFTVLSNNIQIVVSLNYGNRDEMVVYFDDYRSVNCYVPKTVKPTTAKPITTTSSMSYAGATVPIPRSTLNPGANTFVPASRKNN